MRVRALLTVARRGPAAALLLVSAAGWIATAWLLAGGQMPHAAVHATHSQAAGVASSLRLLPSPVPFAAAWLVMIVAMAPPLLLREIGVLRRGSLRRLRSLTTLWFVAGYLMMWMLAGAVLGPLGGLVSGTPVGMAVTAVIVVLWHLSPAHQRCVNGCHRPPTLRVFGPAAHCDALRYGMRTGGYCVGACGLLMLLVLLLNGHHVAAMLVGSLLAIVDRYRPPRQPRWRLPILRDRSPEWPRMPAPILSHSKV